MPRLVDHEERRRAIISAAWRIIATRGIDAINMRDLATEAGYTNGALRHYFSGKDEILHNAFEHILHATNARIEESVRRLRGADALRKMCHEIMPLTEESRLEARIAISLWQRALTDTAMAEVNDIAISAWKARISQHWREAIDAGELPPADLPTGAEAVMTMMIGLQVTSALGSAGGPSPSAQLRMLDSLLNPPLRG